MTIYTGPVFEMARTQFGIIADHLEIPENERARLLYPKRAITVSIPVNMDDGRTEVFQGYRVQHHLTLGPTKGGTRFSASLDIGEVAALAIWMSWKCALAGLPYGGAKGGVACDPPNLSRRELEAVSRRYMQEMIPFVSPQTDVMAPDMGTNEQVMAWFMDTYSMHEGHAVSEIVTGKPVSLGGTEGRREATGRGVAHLVHRACEAIGMAPSGSTAIVQGFGNVGSVSAYTLARRYGVTITGVSDHTAALFDPARASTLDRPARGPHRKTRHPRRLLQPRLSHRSRGPSWTLPCDILVPAARDGTRHRPPPTPAQLQCRILAEGANGPVTHRQTDDAILAQRRDDIFVIPDILCNSGGVIVSYFEWVQDLQRLFWTEAEVNKRLEQLLDSAFTQVRARAVARSVSNRTAAMAIGVEKVRAGKKLRGLFP